MPAFRRPDGYALELSPMRRLMPYLMRGRNESAVYYEQSLDLSRTVPFVQAWNRSHAEPLTLFDLVIAACGRALYARPGLNRFVSGGRIYQRQSVDVAFAVKRAFRDDAPLVTVKLPLAEGESLEETNQRIYRHTTEARSDMERGIDKELRWLDKLPGVALRAAVRLARWASALNVLPQALAKDDPMFSSVFLANLGSLGLDAGYHHLYEYGTTSLFGVVGAVKKVLSVCRDGTTRVHDGVTIRWTFDERIHDGFYAAATLEVLRALVEDPATLMTHRDSQRPQLPAAAVRPLVLAHEREAVS
ncbi:MAG TPA: 2-oxo acid dehydrogenase subunit E2 [Polyangiales bacterium]|nr:2-oxo acid dehydrogenase subunit E2 [Polyangiales bacterium]